MMPREQQLQAAMRQMADWARAWVENETCIAETPSEKLTDAEKGALLIIEMALKIKPDGGI